LAREIAEATTFVLLVGKSGVGPWQVIEYYEALDRRVKQRDFPVVLVLLDRQQAPGLPFLCIGSSPLTLRRRRAFPN
jgi:hypothetical protein